MSEELIVGMTILSIEVDEALLSSVRTICAQSGVELEDLVEDYLEFLSGLDDSAIEQVLVFPNEDEKAKWLAKHYFNVQSTQFTAFEELKNDVSLGHN